MQLRIPGVNSSACVAPSGPPSITEIVLPSMSVIPNITCGKKSLSFSVMNEVVNFANLKDNVSYCANV